MEPISENDNSNINLSNIINNANESNHQINETSNPKEYPFQLITKEQEKKQTSSNINNEEKSENNIKDKDITKSEEENKNNTKKKTIINNNNINNINPVNNNKDNRKKTESKKKNEKKINLDFLSPEIYMRKKMDHTEQNINPLEIKLKRMEQVIQKQCDYDYKRTMQQIKDRLNNIQKNKEQQKHILEEEQKLKEKLKTMEEYREKKIKELAQKVIKKQNRSDKIMKKNKTANKSNYDMDNMSNNSSKNYCQTIESSNQRKLPPINKTPDKYKIIKEKKDLNENEFIQNTEDNLKSLEMEHKENYLYQYKLANGKIKAQNKRHDQRNEQYSKFRMDKLLERNEKFLQKDIARSYNIKLNILRDRSEKSGRLKEHIQKNLESFNEKKEILEQKEKKKIKEYLKKINKYNSGSKNYVSNKIKRQYYSNLQKANANNAEKEFERKYNDYLIKQENLLNIVYDIQQVDSNKRKNLYKNNLLMKNENEEKYQSFSQFLEKMEKSNIINKPDNIKLKIYNKKVREENEEKIRKEEELNK